MRWLLAIMLVLGTGFSAWADDDNEWNEIWLVDSVRVDSGHYNIVWPSNLKSDSLVIFYVDTVAWRKNYKSECPDKNYGIKWGFPQGVLDCNVKHPKTIGYWVPIVETTVVATYPIESKVKRDRWQWRIR